MLLPSVLVASEVVTNHSGAGTHALSARSLLGSFLSYKKREFAAQSFIIHGRLYGRRVILINSRRYMVQLAALNSASTIPTYYGHIYLAFSIDLHTHCQNIVIHRGIMDGFFFQFARSHDRKPRFMRKELLRCEKHHSPPTDEATQYLK